MIFTPDDNLIVADKFGCVFMFPMDDDTAGCLLLGHFSLICDMEINEDYIITADRDEKIRVSRRKTPYVIESFCLGHSQFVSRLSWIDDYQKLVSGGGDMKLMVWDVTTGTCLTSMDMKGIFKSSEEEDMAISAIACIGSFIVCAAEK